MKRFLTFLLLACSLALPVLAQTQPRALYYVVFLRPAPDRKALPKEQMEKIQADHMANIHAMADRGVLLAAGPFGDTPPTISGVFIFKTSSLEEARRIASADPTVVEHRNLVDVFAWRGPAGLGDEYVRLHKADPKTPEDMGIQPFMLLRRGPSFDRRADVQTAHGEYLQKLRSEGKIAASGPVEGDPDIVGVVVYNRIPDADARKLADEDPFVKAGVARIEQHRWYCAAHVLPGW